MSRYLSVVVCSMLCAAPLTALRPDTLLEKTAIVLQPGQTGSFVLGDNLSSFFGGKPFRYEAGNSYYSFSDSVAFRNGVILNRREARSVALLPHKVTSRYAGAVEETVMFSGEGAMGLRVVSAEPARLALFPIIYLYKANTTIRTGPDLVTLEPRAGKREPTSAVALLTSVPVRVEAIARQTDPELYKVNRFRPDTVKLRLTAIRPGQELRVIVAFGPTAAAAEAKARRLARGNPWLRADRKTLSVIGDSRLITDDAAYNRAVSWSLASAYSMVVEEFGKGIWAGLPWFRDNWGRDTFIALPGTLLVNGRFEEARQVIENFARFQNRGEWVVRIRVPAARFAEAARLLLAMRTTVSLAREGAGLLARPIDSTQQTREGVRAIADTIRKRLPFAAVSSLLLRDRTYGRIPNRVNKSSIIYNTTDGTPWFVREVLEYLQYSGDTAFAARIYPVVRTALDSTIRYRTDRKRFLVHDAADTWMDAKIDGRLPWSPRDSRAVEIQVLWYQALRAGIRLARINGDVDAAKKWEKTAATLQRAFLAHFWDPKKNIMADRLRPDGRPDYSVRPNQLMLLSVPLEGAFVPDRVGARILRNAVNTLLYPWGIASLDPKHPWFHPHHDGGWLYHKDAAYHNGTIWGWNAGFTVSALTRYARQDFAWKLTRELTRQILTLGCLGSMSENLHAWPDKQGRITLSGTYSQAWSVSEFARNAFQDYGGFRPRLLDDELVLEPAFPKAWKRVEGRFRFGKRGVLLMRYHQGGYALRTVGTRRTLTLRFRPLATGVRYETLLRLVPGREYRLTIGQAGSCAVDGKAVKTICFRDSFAAAIGRLRFVRPGSESKVKALRSKQYLRKLVMDGKVQ